MAERSALLGVARVQAGAPSAAQFVVEGRGEAYAVLVAPPSAPPARPLALVVPVTRGRTAHEVARLMASEVYLRPKSAMATSAIASAMLSATATTLMLTPALRRAVRLRSGTPAA